MYHLIGGPSLIQSFCFWGIYLYYYSSRFCSAVVLVVFHFRNCFRSFSCSVFPFPFFRNFLKGRFVLRVFISVFRLFHTVFSRSSVIFSVQIFLASFFPSLLLIYLFERFFRYCLDFPCHVFSPFIVNLFERFSPDYVLVNEGGNGGNLPPNLPVGLLVERVQSYLLHRVQSSVYAVAHLPHREGITQGKARVRRG